MSAGGDWQALMSTWQAQRIDLPQLRRSTRWKTRRMWINTILEILVILFMLVVMVRYWEISAEKPLIRYWMVFWGALTPLLAWWTLRCRLRVWRTADDSVRGLLQLRLDRARSGIRMARFTIGLCIVMAVTTAAWLLALVNSMPAPGHGWRALGWSSLFTGGWLLAFGIGSVLYIRRRRVEMAQVEQLLRELDSSQ